jgi:hypothetical protein
MEEQNQLVEVAQQAGLEQNRIQELMKSFGEYFKQAQEVVAKSKDLIVTDVLQTNLMKKAREVRLSLKEIRVNVEKNRVSLKEQSVREGKAIDGLANVIKAIIVPIEEKLQEQEDYIVNLEKKRLADRYFERINKLGKYVDDITMTAFDINNMSDETFENILESSRLSFETKIAAEKKAEDDRIKKEELDKRETKRIISMSNLEQFIDNGVDLDFLYKKATDEEFSKIQNKTLKNREEYNKEQEKIRLENEKLKQAEIDREKELEKIKEIQDKKIEDERIAKQKEIDEANKKREEAEAKLKSEKEAQEKKDREAKEKEDARIATEEEAKRKALIAPDKEKIISFSNQLSLLKTPAVESNEAQQIFIGANIKIMEAITILQEGAKKL